MCLVRGSWCGDSCFNICEQSELCGYAELLLWRGDSSPIGCEAVAKPVYTIYLINAVTDLGRLRRPSGMNPLTTKQSQQVTPARSGRTRPTHPATTTTSNPRSCGGSAVPRCLRR